MTRGHAGAEERPVVLVYLTLPESGEIRGGARSMLLTAKHLSRYRPVFVFNRPTELQDDLAAAGLESRVVASGRLLDGIRAASWRGRLDKILQIVRIDRELLQVARSLDAPIVHCQDPSEAILVGIAARLSGRGVFLHLRDGPRLPHLRLSTLLATLVASGTVCVSEAVRERYIEVTPSWLRPLVARRLEAIPNGLDPAAITEARKGLGRAEARRSLGVPPGDWLLTVVGPLSPKKNQLELLEEAGAGLLGLGGDVRLLFVGSDRFDATYTNRCRKAAARLPEGGARVTFLGELPFERMLSVYAATDVLLLPSLVEGLPRVALEAQAMGCPIVATAIAGNRAAIEEGVGGLFVDRVADMPRVVAPLRDPKLRDRMSAAGHDQVIARFDVRRVTPRIEAVYDRIGRRGTVAVPTP